MGRKKQKVRWTTVEDGFFDSENLLKSPQVENFTEEYTTVTAGTKKILRKIFQSWNKIQIQFSRHLDIWFLGGFLEKFAFKIFKS